MTLWAPADDSVVPPLLVDHLARQLPSIERVDVAGAHDWLMENWATVFGRIAAH